MKSLISALNIDIVLHLLDLLERSHPRSLLNLASTSRDIYSLAEGFFYRTLLLTDCTADPSLLKCKKYIDNVQDVTFGPRNPSYQRSGHNYGLLAEFLSRCRRLKRLQWGAAHIIPKLILNVLADSSPQIRLHYEVRGVWDTYVTLSDLRFHPNLVSLAVTLGNSAELSFLELQVVALSCPNLTILSVTIFTNDDQPEVPQWRVVPGKVLHLNTLELDGCCSGVTGAAEVANMTDMSILKNLSILNVYSVPVLSCENLTTLQIALSDQRPDTLRDLDQIVELLYRCDFIEELALTGATTCVDAPLLKHLGRTLKVLRIHEYESKLGPKRRQTLSELQLEAIRFNCPKLDVLGLDIGYDGQWPYSTFDHLSELFCFFVKLEFYLELNIADPDHPLQPAATYTSVAHIWDHLWSNMKRVREACQGSCANPRLRELNVTAGSFRPSSSTGKVWWEESQQQRFCARACEGKERHGLARVTCMEVENLPFGTADDCRQYVTSRATHGPSTDTGPDKYMAYMSYITLIGLSSPTPGD